MVLSQDHYARSEEQESLEERMSHEMKHGCRPGADAERQEHVPDLADRGIGKDTLDVSLRKCAATRKQQCQGADRRYGGLYRWRKLKEYMRTGDQIHARC